MAEEKPPTPMVNLTIDGRSVSVPKGTNLIQAAASVGIEIPHYCYHPHLSVPGNCRMCQVEVKGQAKMQIGCNTKVAEGMEILTQNSSPRAQQAQASTLEFILINHPLDCTVCDQAGHCKLQDYHYEYNARPSRFLEEKVHKVKAEPLGPTVMLDGERCIMCTRCIRFCDEITETSELGMLNRGDRSVIAVAPGRELDNPLSGTVVDLCPVGALTHRRWRFNTRIWFTKETDSICPGCSTGCNVRVAERDGEVVQVKARMNAAVNKEWLCDEGRYGFGRFLPAERVVTPWVEGKSVTLSAAVESARALGTQDTLVLVSPDLMTEEYVVLKRFVEAYLRNATVAVAYRERQLTKTEAILISPDYAANFRGAEFAGLVSGDLGAGYLAALEKLQAGAFGHVLLIGDGALDREAQRNEVIEGVRRAALSVAIISDARSEVARAARVVLPGRTVIEKSGLLINRNRRLQYAERVVGFPEGTEPAWRWLNHLAESRGGRVAEGVSDRDLTLEYLAKEPRLLGLRIATIKGERGIDLSSFTPGAVSSSSLVDARSLA